MLKALQFGLEALLVVGFLLLVYVQLARPLMRGTPVFPMFRKRPKLEREMEEVAEAVEIQTQQRVLARERKKLGPSKKKPDSVGTGN